MWLIIGLQLTIQLTTTRLVKENVALVMKNRAMYSNQCNTYNNIIMYIHEKKTFKLYKHYSNY